MEKSDNHHNASLEKEISQTVRDITQKKEAMARWDKEYSRKNGRGWIIVGLMASAACVALMLFIGVRDFGRPDEPVLRGGLSYDAALERIDSLINAGNTIQAKETIRQVREEIATDTLKRFHGEDVPMKDEIEYERLLLKDVSSRLDELENKILKTNE